mgnify:CR=1 FL=1
MTFDNGKTIIRLRLRLFVASVLLLVYIYLVYYGKQLRFPILGIQEIHATLVLITLYLLFAFLPLILRYRYIYFSDDGRHIIFRYYAVGFLSGKKSSVEIPKNEFVGYDIKKSFAGLIKAIYLYRIMGNKKASYSPVYISSLSGKEIEKIKRALNTYLKKE